MPYPIQPPGEKRDCQHVKARHQHGTYLAYVSDRCRCIPCREAIATKQRQTKKQHAYGRPPRVNAEQPRQHLRGLISRGMTYQDAAQQLGVGTSWINQILNGDAPTMTRRTADRIMALTFTPSPRKFVNAAGTTRRLQALAAIGYSQRRLAEMLGWDQRRLSAYVRGENATVTNATKTEVTALYDRLWDQPATGNKSALTMTRNHARRNGWAPPMAWDDHALDDPNATPHMGETIDTRAAWIEDITWLAENGSTWGELETRFNTTVSNMRKRLTYCGVNHVAERITTNTTERGQFK